MMHTKLPAFLTVAMLAVLPWSASADVKDKPSTKRGKATLVPASDVKYTEDPKFPGVHIASLDGDHEKGPAHFIAKLDAGFSAPLHHHTADHYVTVLAGTIVLTVDGKATQLPAGSYFSFTGKRPHSTRCEAGTDCVLSVDARDKWDVIPEVTSMAPPAKR